jgi:hypothetical protein
MDQALTGATGAEEMIVNLFDLYDCTSAAAVAGPCVGDDNVPEFHPQLGPSVGDDAGSGNLG